MGHEMQAMVIVWLIGFRETCLEGQAGPIRNGKESGNHFRV